MRDEAEVQRAHDMLAGIILGEVPLPLPNDKLCCAIDVLCWVLRHDHNDSFAKNLMIIEMLAAEAGFVLRDKV